MDNKHYLNKIVKAKIDRPLGSKHPKYNYIYPINYGYIPNTISGDGEELDCYILGVFEPILSAICNVLDAVLRPILEVIYKLLEQILNIKEGIDEECDINLK